MATINLSLKLYDFSYVADTVKVSLKGDTKNYVLFDKVSGVLEYNESSFFQIYVNGIYLFSVHDIRDAFICIDNYHFYNEKKELNTA